MPGGGSDAPPPSQSSTTITRQELSPEQRELLNLALPNIREFAQTPIQQFPGSGIVPFNPAEQAAQQGALNFAQGPLQNIISSPTQGLEFLSSGQALFPETNPALQASINAATRPLTQAFEQNILPNIRNEAVAAGGFGGSRQGIAEGIASQALQQGIGDVSANISNQAFQNAMDNMSRSLLVAPQIAGLNLLPFDVQGAVGAQQRALEQAQLSEEVQRFMNEQLLPFQQSQAIAGLAFGLPGGSTISQSTGTAGAQGGGGGGGGFQGGIQGAFSGAATGAAVSGGNPFAAAGGAVLGGLMGAFF
jgi:hypothetical protein